MFYQPDEMHATRMYVADVYDKWKRTQYKDSSLFNTLLEVLELYVTQRMSSAELGIRTRPAPDSDQRGEFTGVNARQDGYHDSGAREGVSNNVISLKLEASAKEVWKNIRESITSPEWRWLGVAQLLSYVHKAVDNKQADYFRAQQTLMGRAIEASDGDDDERIPSFLKDELERERPWKTRQKTVELFLGVINRVPSTKRATFAQHQKYIELLGRGLGNSKAAAEMNLTLADTKKLFDELKQQAEKDHLNSLKRKSKRGLIKGVAERTMTGKRADRIFKQSSASLKSAVTNLHLEGMLVFINSQGPRTPHEISELMRQYDSMYGYQSTVTENSLWF